MTADEIFIDEEWERNLAGLVERYVDLDLILRVAGWQERSETVGEGQGRGGKRLDSRLRGNDDGGKCEGDR